MNSRKNMPLVVGGAICAVLLLVALFFLFRFGSAYRAEQKVLKSQYQRLEQLNTRKPFPSAENVEKVKDNLAALEANLQTLMQALNKNSFQGQDLKAVDFSSRVQRAIQRFKDKAQEGNVALPQNMEIGFGQYASGGALPAPENVGRLVQQLHSIERVANILIKSGVISIEALEREVFEKPESQGEEGADADAGSQSRRSSRRSRAPAKAAPDKKQNVASFVHPDGLYTFERVSVVFTAREDNLWRVMDLLASSPQLISISEIAFETQTKIMSYSPADVVEAEAGMMEGNESLKSLAARVLSGTKLSRQERQIAGDETIRASMKVDVYQFERSEQSEEQQP
ncbi:MAG: Amuc_1100 family pilus-like protein [Kiritimatiellales bacterium]|nr:Amuc_1100 family pilus-like protein [Kiritimatiellales bacterium]